MVIDFFSIMMTIHDIVNIVIHDIYDIMNKILQAHLKFCNFDVKQASIFTCYCSLFIAHILVVFVCIHLTNKTPCVFIVNYAIFDIR